MSEANALDERVLILAPIGRDGTLAGSVLAEAGLQATVCADIAALCREIDAGAGAVLVTKEALAGYALDRLAAVISAQPPWSDLPLIVLTSGGAGTAAGRQRVEALSVLGGTTLLERPLRVMTLVSTLRAALQARRRQYEVREHLAERARLEAALQAEYEKQHHIAETLQMSLLPTVSPDQFPSLEVVHVYQAAWQEADIGGDFFDVFALNGERVALVVGDVSGKGLQAASRTAEVKYSLRAFLREDPVPSRALDRLNDFLLDGQLLDGQPLDHFVCLALGVLETETGVFTVASAGAEAPLLLAAHGEPRPLGVGGPPLGVTATAVFPDERLLLAPDDTILLVTDGITEARRGREFFGYEGLVEAACRPGARASLELLGQSVIDAAAAFAEGHLHDDVCLLLARWRGYCTTSAASG